MGERKKPVGATDIANEVTDPGRRMTMLTVILNKLEFCGRAQKMTGPSEGTTKEEMASRCAAIAASLLWILRDSDLAEDEARRVTSEIKRTVRDLETRKQWRAMVDRYEHKPRLPLLITLLNQIDALCTAIAKMHRAGGGDSDPLLVTESRDFAKLAAKRIRLLDVPEEYKAMLFEQQTEDIRPHKVTASEAGAEVLFKILRESHMSVGDCRDAKEVLVAQMTRDYLPKSMFLEKIIDTLDELKKRDA